MRAIFYVAGWALVFCACWALTDRIELAAIATMCLFAAHFLLDAARS